MDRILILVSGGGLFLGVFAAGLLIAPPRGKIRANRVLSLLMLLCALNIAHSLMSFVWPHAFPFNSSYLIEPLQFLMAPLIAAYFRTLILEEFRLTPRHLIHALPMLIVVGFILSPAPQAVERAAGLPVVTVGIWIALVVQAFAYLAPSLRLLHGYRRSLKDRVSNTAGVDLGWLMWFAHLALTLLMCYVVVLVFLLHAPETLGIRAFMSVGMSELACALGFRGLMQKEPPRIPGAGGKAQEAPKYGRSALAPQDALDLRRRLEHAMEADKLYLDPELDLTALADRVGEPRNRVSYVINQVIGANFFDFVNGYRVREVLRLMGDESHSRDKLISLAFDSGFNSKPTFSAVFKKLTGRTPSSHRREADKLV